MRRRAPEPEPDDPDFGDQAAKLLREAALMMATDADRGYIGNETRMARMAGRLEALADDLERMEIAKTVYAVPHAQGVFEP